MRTSAVEVMGCKTDNGSMNLSRTHNQTATSEKIKANFNPSRSSIACFDLVQLYTDQPLSWGGFEAGQRCLRGCILVSIRQKESKYAKHVGPLFEDLTMDLTCVSHDVVVVSEALETLDEKSASELEGSDGLVFLFLFCQSE